MDSSEKPQNTDCEYQIATYKKVNGMFQGVVLVTAYAGIQQKPIVEIPTSLTFQTQHAAKIEASALASRLIETGAMIALLPQRAKPE
ncbi:hypothetical protein O0882_23555 [Janthinobacterium sp. SUN073]|uniref:hypothetical protein n=1 Tax=Janthinobacterium sp. SUN073 TaxID=3004102 RepID=UPI0025B14F43|nr:hypothetical protein [Janthinobacterium sp. SUN073]MDN2699297.1 hypothetical protein [Janthinobacterium sp. SUN073]